jgi:hypothetical protein
MKFATQLLVLGLSLSACGEDPTAGYGGDEPAQNDLGLRADALFAGQLFQLNIIGVPKDKGAKVTSGNRIFIPLEGTSKVLLSEGAFAVLDGNGTDGSASFRLPSPDPDGDGQTSYSVFARPVGKPGGTIRATTCATDPATNTDVCSLETLVKTRSRGQNAFTNVSRELLSISADIDGDGVVERVPLFDSRLQGFLWNFDNDGLKVLQLRFKEIPTTL